jgi:hypothetical protein
MQWLGLLSMFSRFRVQFLRNPKRSVQKFCFFLTHPLENYLALNISDRSSSIYEIAEKSPQQ